MSSGKSTLVRFKADYPTPYREDMVDVEAIGKLSIPDGTVVEFKWDHDKNWFTPLRIRYDKDWPNHINVAADSNWPMIHDPIRESTLLGTDIVLMRKYFNRLKKYILLKSSRSYRSLPTLIDIGSGRGGDIAKWVGNYSKILAVEPNQSHIEELVARARALTGYDPPVITSADELIQVGKSNQIVVLRSTGESHNLITKVAKSFFGSKVDVISSMLSLSFFWKNRETFGGLVSTIKKNLSPTGEFVFVTIDGDKVEQAFSPAFHGPAKKELVYNNNSISMVYTPPTLQVDFRRTIVEKQEEWLVRLGDLILALPNYKLTDVSGATGEKLVSSGGRVMMKLYTSGRFVPAKAKQIARPKRTAARAGPKMPRKLDQIATGSAPRREDITLEKPRKVIKLRGPVIIKRKRSKKRMLKPLLVSYDAITMTGKGDDVVETLSVPWYTQKEVVRIACMGNGSCFFHSILKAFYTDYANTTSYRTRTDIVRKFRRDLALALGVKQTGEDTLIYQNILDGMLPDLAMQQSGGMASVDSLNNGIDYSLEGMQSLINSTRDIGDELYGIIAELLGLDVYVTRGSPDNLSKHTSTYNADKKRERAVVIVGNGIHYELIGVREKEGIQTLFTNEDPFVAALRSLRV